MAKKIKWCAIQPLTGGMYLGAEKAVGCPAEFIISYPGIGDPHKDKEGNLVGAGNEYHLMTYLDKVGRRPEYKVFNRNIFQNDDDMNPELLNHDLWTKNPDAQLDYSNMDLVVAVPVCAGLSTATNGSQEAKETRNCNMIWISKYALRVIKPNVYIFENAPTFMGARGEYIRVQLEALAKETGYTIGYYRTDTKLHDNCQTRKRTFIAFYKKDYAPQMGFENIQTNIAEYFGRIPEDKRNPDTELDMEYVNPVNYFIISYLKERFGDNWRQEVNYNVFKYIIENKLWGEVLDYTNNRASYKIEKRREYMNHFVEHFNFKTSQGKGVYHSLPNLLKNDGTCPAVMFKMVQSCLHPDKDRLLNMRELMHLMGLPHEFEMQGEPLKTYAQIGQNVPVRTAQWIVSEALRAFERDNDLEEKKAVRFFDNTKGQEVKYGE